jgi:hypothetical protein
MNKKILATVIFTALSATYIPAHAIDIDPAAQSIIDTAITNECTFDIEENKECDFNAILATAITNNSTLAESLVAAILNAAGANTEAAEDIIATAISVLGADSPLIPSILTIATEVGVNSDTVTAIAIASGVDATIASEATAAGATGGNIIGDTGNALANNAGGGGGGGGISANQ